MIPCAVLLNANGSAAPVGIMSNEKAVFSISSLSATATATVSRFCGSESFAVGSVNTIIHALQKIHCRKTWKQLLLLLQMELVLVLAGNLVLKIAEMNLDSIL
jgi:hypothetical protein